MQVPIDDIHYDTRFNCRGPIDLTQVQSLAGLIQADGRLLNPVTVRPSKKKPWHLIAGHRRFLACRDILKWKEIPVTVIDPCPDRMAYQINLVENLGRQQLHLGQEVRAIERIFGEDASPAAVAKVLGVTERWAAARTRVARLEPSVRKAAMSGKLTATDVILLLTFPQEGQPSVLHDLLVAKKGKEGTKTVARLKGNSHRSRSAILNMMTTILERGIQPTWARSLAWAAGTISDEDFLDNP